MDEIVRQITQRTGISDAQAREAVQVVMGFLSDKLPPPLAAQVTSLLESPQADDAIKQALGSVGGLLGNQS
jgi:uncharacterized protein (DUF2267 family)